MLLIWRGLGVLVFVIAFACSLVANLIINRVMGDDVYWRNHGWPLASALIVAGAFCYLLGHLLNRAAARNLVDPQFKARVGIPSRNEFFFIKVQWWGPILVGIGLIVLLTGWRPG